MEAILDSIDARGRQVAFETQWALLEASPRINFDTLRVCVRLLEPSANAPNDAEASNLTESSHKRLWALVESRISVEEDLGRLFAIADVCLTYASFAVHINGEVYCTLARLLEELKAHAFQREERVYQVLPYLKFSMCSFWRPTDQFHLVNHGTIALLSCFVGIEGAENSAHDALSALFSLLKSSKPSATAPNSRQLESNTNFSLMETRPIVDQTLWLRLRDLEPKHFTSSNSKIFRTWFQWISQVVLDGLEVSCIHEGLYWDRLLSGLVNGFGDQRKYCLGIIHQSLRAAQQDILIPTMRYSVNERSLYLRAYQKFSSLFETVVFNRYPNQVEACLPELLTLFGTHSKVTPAMAISLLTAALNPKIQEGIRKLIGNWYMKNVINVSQSRSYFHLHV